MEWITNSRKNPNGFRTSDARNARTHDDRNLGAIQASLERFGQRFPVVVQAQGRVVRAGNGRVRAARALGWTHVATVVVDETDIEATAFALADNRTAELAAWDEEVLRELLAELDAAPDIDAGVTGFSDAELRALVDAPLLEGLTDPDDIPEPPAEPRTEPGDIWQLGPHRLICGDCRDPEVVARLFEGEAADMLLTDPPYGVAYADKNEMLNEYEKGTRIQRPIANDDLEDYRVFFREFLDLAPLREPNTAYVFMSGRHLHNLVLAMGDAGMKTSQVLVWVKNNHVLGRQDYSPKHEFVAYGWRGRHRFHGPFRTTLLEYDRPRESDLHPTMKPVALLEQLLADGSEPGALVYDPFLGSGSTLIAAERTGRRVFGCELEPVYCDVVVERWEGFSGGRAARDGVGAGAPSVR